MFSNKHQLHHLVPLYNLIAPPTAFIASYARCGSKAMNVDEAYQNQVGKVRLKSRLVLASFLSVIHVFVVPALLLV